MSDPSELNLVVTTDPSELSMTDMADLILLGLAAIHGYQTAPWSSTKYSCPNPGLLDLVCLLDLMCLDLAIYARPKQTTNKQRIIVHTQLLGERKKRKTINHRRQSNHDISTWKHVCVSSYNADDQIWSPRSISRASLTAQVSSTRWDMWNTCHKLSKK